MVAHNKAGENPLEILKVIDRLEVGPVHLERRRITAPYRVVQKGKVHTEDLIYRFEEDVFLPDEPASLNLASMIASQAAVNYGLFCNEIVFSGYFDSLDERFIQEMAGNTAREIFVKKFLEPNPFLQGPVTGLQAVKRGSYLLANLKFTFPLTSSSEGKGAVMGEGWRVAPSRHAVLCSGGKDSLLTFGLLQEIGREVHPVFINESGRHWFTALNAYRYLSSNIPNTARVWTNSDRVFNWMLRHLSFVRQDFAKIRSDEYPVRLWSVAVFLFGALPILRKRGIGRLLIGDEFDTTRRLSYKGVTHYDGLYDQSRYFDNALSRYFHRKNWGVSQFSILRPLSEILILRILTNRYPELHHQQVSCHAAHKEEDRILPCGHCEKCRRIVSMLKAIEADPSKCGYGQKQIDRCLRDLSDKGLHQDIEDIKHLAFLLAEKGLLSGPAIGSVKPHQAPHVMKLRFDPNKSPAEDIPTDLRQALYRLYLEHADGAVKRNGRLWIDFDPLTDPALSRPYPFEAPQRTPSSQELKIQGEQMDNRSIYMLGDLTWPEAQRRFKEVDVALLPVGSVEQHGPHLPLDTDAFDAEYLAKQVADACSDPRPIVLPVISYGVSYHHEDFTGTISVSPEALSQLVYDIGMSLARHGITKLLVINGHGGNGPALHFAAQKINRDAHIFTCVDTGESSDPDVYAIAETPNDVHSGEIETSTTLAVRPHVVRGDLARKFIPRFSSRYLDFTSRQSVAWYAHIAKISPSGVLGDPTKASPEKGRKMLDLMIKNLVEFVEDLKNLSLDEIYQKKY